MGNDLRVFSGEGQLDGYVVKTTTLFITWDLFRNTVLHVCSFPKPTKHPEKIHFLVIQTVNYNRALIMYVYSTGNK